MTKTTKLFFLVPLLLLFGFLVFIPEVRAHFRTDNQCFRGQSQEDDKWAHKCGCVGEKKVCYDYIPVNLYGILGVSRDKPICSVPLSLIGLPASHEPGDHHPGACATTDLPAPPPITTTAETGVVATIWSDPPSPVAPNQPFKITYIVFSVGELDQLPQTKYTFPFTGKCLRYGTWSSSELLLPTYSQTFQFNNGDHNFGVRCEDSLGHVANVAVRVNVSPPSGPGPGPTTGPTPGTCERNDNCSPGQCWNINQVRPCVKDPSTGWTCWKDPIVNCSSNTRCESLKGCVDNTTGVTVTPTPTPTDGTPPSGGTTSGGRCLSQGNPECGNCDGQCGDTTCSGTCSKNSSIRCNPPSCAIVLNPCSKNEAGSTRPCPGGGNQTCYAQPNGAYEWTACPAPRPAPDSGLDPCTPSQSGSARACSGPNGGAQYCYVNNETGRYEWTACPSSPAGGAGAGGGDGAGAGAGGAEGSGAGSGIFKNYKLKEIIPDFFNLNWFKVNVANFLKAKALGKE